jgi:hypothetical protein
MISRMRSLRGTSITNNHENLEIVVLFFAPLCGHRAISPTKHHPHIHPSHPPRLLSDHRHRNSTTLGRASNKSDRQARGPSPVPRLFFVHCPLESSPPPYRGPRERRWQRTNSFSAPSASLRQNRTSLDLQPPMAHHSTRKLSETTLLPHSRCQIIPLPKTALPPPPIVPRRTIRHSAFDII